MSIFNKDLRLFKQDFSCKDGNKEKYGEVNTDFRLVEKIQTLPSKFLIKEGLSKAFIREGV